MISRLPRYEDVIGDDAPYVSLRYGNVPEGFGFPALPLPGKDCPLTATAWPELIAYAHRHYRNHEIVGETLTDFQMNLEDAYLTQADTLERLLEVYHDDIAKPILGRTEKTVYDLTNQTDGTTKNGSTSKGKNTDDSTDETVNVPLDAPASDQPNGRNKANGTATSEGSTDTTGEAHDTNKQTGSVTTELSDLGVRPNYESLNGFLDNNRTAKEVFAGIFKDCFTLLQYQTF